MFPNLVHKGYTITSVLKKSCRIKPNLEINLCELKTIYLMLNEIKRLKTKSSIRPFVNKSASGILILTLKIPSIFRLYYFKVVFILK